jgi:hypothetical protein
MSVVVAAVRISAAEVARTLPHTQRRTFQGELAGASPMSPMSHMPAHLFARLTLRVRHRHSMQRFTARQRTLQLSVM